MSVPEQTDVAIVGAGTAGAAAAMFVARRGLRVVCLDRGPLGEAGARWVNGVPRWVFDEVGLARPRAPELRPPDRAFHLQAGFDGPRLTIPAHDIVPVDMRLFGKRLLDEAAEAGAELIGECRVEGLDDDRLRTSSGTIRADVIVDASGLAGLNLLGAPKVPPRDLCVAAQEVRRCDLAGARAWFDAHAAAIGDTLCFSSIAGGYSILNVHVHDDELSLLAGSVPVDGNRSGRGIIDDFVAAQDWIGPALFGGARALPIRRPHDRLTRGRVTAIGDAACQVFPAHGSGIAPQLLAGRLLGDRLADGEGVEDYACTFMRRHGGTLAGYDLFRRFSQSLPTAELAKLLDSGLMSERSTRAGMEQRMPPPPSLDELRDLARALRGMPRVAGRLGSIVARMVAIHGLYAAYPRVPALIERWSAAVSALFER